VDSVTHFEMTAAELPLFAHALKSPSAFTPERLMEAVRRERRLSEQPVPPLCVLDFDGDLSDHLARENISSPWESWACFRHAPHPRSGYPQFQLRFRSCAAADA
jgi:hypothetical protein